MQPGSVKMITSPFFPVDGRVPEDSLKTLRNGRHGTAQRLSEKACWLLSGPHPPPPPHFQLPPPPPKKPLHVAAVHE